MKTILLKSIKSSVILGIFLFGSCAKENVKIDESNNDIYYVRYSIQGNGAYGRFSNWTVSTPDQPYSNKDYQTRSWTQTYGPVKKGFNCSVNIGNSISGEPTIEIHVSKNDSPFALKKTEKGKSAYYKIDY